MIRWEVSSMDNLVGYIGTQKVAKIEWNVSFACFMAYFLNKNTGNGFDSYEPAKKECEEQAKRFVESAGLVVDNVCEWTTTGKWDKEHNTIISNTGCGNIFYAGSDCDPSPYDFCPHCRGRIVVKEEGK